MTTSKPSPYHDGVEWMLTLRAESILRLLLRLLSYATSCSGGTKAVLVSEQENFPSTGPGISKSGDSARCRHRQHMRSQRDSNQHKLFPLQVLQHPPLTPLCINQGFYKTTLVSGDPNNEAKPVATGKDLDLLQCIIV